MAQTTVPENANSSSSTSNDVPAFSGQNEAGPSGYMTWEEYKSSSTAKSRRTAEPSEHDGGDVENPRNSWHSVEIKVPFPTFRTAHIAMRSLAVDREQNAQFVERTMNIVDERFLLVRYRASTVRLLRLASNSFMSSLDLAVSVMAKFDVPRPTDAELEEARRRSNRGVEKGIELKGDGKGAGSGQELTEE